MFNLTCNKQKCQYDSPKIINLIKKKNKAKQRTRIKFILLKVMIFSFLSFLNEIKFNSDSEIKRFDGNSKELFDSNFIFISKNINKRDRTDIMRNKSISELAIKNDGAFLKHLLLLSGDIEANPGPVQLPPNA